MLGDYIKSDNFPPEAIKISFRMYRVFEDIYQEAYCFLKQAEAGDAKAQFIIVYLLYDGIGIRKSRSESREWTEQAKKTSGLSHVRVTGGRQWWVYAGTAYL